MRIIRPVSNEHRCGDAFQTACWAAVVLRVAFERLTQNGAIITALRPVLVAEQLGPVPTTTPVASRESNELAEAVVQTLRRD